MIDAICAALADIGGDVTGIVKAFDPPPPNLDGGVLPALYVLTGQAQHDDLRLGADNVLVTRDLRVQVAVIPTASGDPNTRERICRPLLEAVTAAYRSHPHLKGLARVREMRVASDSGIVLLPEWGARYIGFELRIAVITVETRSIARGE